MDPLLLRIFQRQVTDQCRVALTAVPVINRAAADGDHDSLWVGCQMFVVGAGNLSKAFWGEGRSRERIAPLRKPLRDSLGVEDSSPLYKVSVRNHFEHYDERIDRWWAESTTRSHLDRVIGPPEMLGDFAEIDTFRIYDPATTSIIFWGERFELQSIVAEAARIFPLAEAAARKPPW